MKPYQYILLTSILIFYGTFLWLDFFQPEYADASTLIKYVSQWSIAFLAYSVSLPMAATLVCDYLLLFTTHYVIAIAVFATAHLLYASRLKSSQTNVKILLKLCLVPIFLLFLPLELNCIAYLFAFGYHAYCAYKKQPEFPRRLYLTALFLFFLCDCNVALYHLTNVPIYGTIIWLFYTPSQILLTLILWKDSSIGWLSPHK